MSRPVTEFDVRRLVIQTARAFFECDDFSRRRELLAELLTAIVNYAAHQKWADPLSLAEMAADGHCTLSTNKEQKS